MRTTKTMWIGNGKVVDRPGTFETKLICGGRPVRQQFVVKEKAKAPEAPGPTQPQPKKPQIVKPKGAPQTGGGATA